MKRSILWPAIVAMSLAGTSPVVAQDLTAAQSKTLCADLLSVTARSGADKLAAAQAICKAATPKPAPTPKPVPTPTPVPAPPPVVVVTPPPVTPPVTPPVVTPPPVGTLPAGALLQLANLVYQGAFHLPQGIHAGGSANAGFEYGGTGLSYNPARNSLFLVGHPWDSFVGEISIPGVGGTASLLQMLTDGTEGKLQTVNPGSSTQKLVGGTLVAGGTLILTGYDYYDVNNGGTQRVSHFTRAVDLSVKGQVVGPVQVGPLNAGYYDGYMTWVPAEWQAALGGPALTGQSDIPGPYRTSSGPAAFAFDPAKLTPTGAIALLYYPLEHSTIGKWGDGGNTPLYSGADTVRGIVFPAGTSSVLFFGKHGQTYCYGPGTADQSKAGTPATDIGDTADKWCYDPADSSKGNHGYPYQSMVWAYDAHDLAAVKAGTKAPWEIVPYAAFALPNIGKEIGGAAYDPATGRIYVSEMIVDANANPVVHVLHVQ